MPFWGHGDKVRLQRTERLDLSHGCLFFRGFQGPAAWPGTCLGVPSCDLEISIRCDFRVKPAMTGMTGEAMKTSFVSFPGLALQLELTDQLEETVSEGHQERKVVSFSDLAAGKREL